MDTELDLKEILIMLWEKAWIIAASVCLCGAAVFIYSQFIATPIYSATTSMYVYNGGDRTNNIISQGDLATSQKLVNTYIVIMKSNAVLSEVKDSLGLDYSVEQLRNKMSASAINSTEAFSITVQDADPKKAQLIANTIARVAPDEIMRVVKAGSVEVIDYAELPVSPTSPHVAKNTVIGAMLGFMLAAMGIVVYGMFDTVIVSEQNLNKLFDIPVIGIIPSFDIETESYEEKRDR